MDWTLKVRGQPVTLTLIDGVTAVRPTWELLKEAISPAAFLPFFGDSVGAKTFETIDGERTRSDRRMFRNAGWYFVHPLPEVAFAAERGESISNATAVRSVYAAESGNLMIGTNLATVQLHSDMTEDQVNESLKSDGLEIVYRLGFAPNLIEVRVLPGRPYHEVIDELQEKTDRYVFAEPSLLETITGRLKPDDVNLNDQWQHAKPPLNGGNGGFGINSLDAWDITLGRGPNRPVRIAIIDVGMQISHPEFKDGIIGGGFFSPEDGDPATPDFFPLTPGMTDFPDDEEDHGTFCLGMAGARMNNEGRGCGSAPEADLIAIACALDQTGTQTTLARAIEAAVNPTKIHPEARPEGGADVISCSLATGGVFKEVLKKAIDFATSRGRNELGTPIFWAVDNEHVEIANTDVCSDPGVIAVGRSDRNGQNNGSAFGDRLAFLAPGMRVFSTRSDSLFDVDDGTSFATPLAAGVAALVLSVNPGLTANQVANLLRETCDPIGGVVGHHPELGHGRLNAAAAVAKAKALIP